MSADNGVYILKTRDQFRVIHTQAIDNLFHSCVDPNFYMNHPGKFVPSRVLEYFGPSKCTSDYDMAKRVANGILHSLPVCEYGIVELDYHKSWKKIVKEAKKYARLELDYINSKEKKTSFDDMMIKRLYSVIDYELREH